MAFCERTPTEKFYYTEAGEGTPIIFLHGNLSTGRETFTSQMEYFSRSFRCICPDMRCHGNSVSDNYFWTPKDLSEDVVWMMDQMDIGQAHFVGHSMGGDTMMYIMLNHRERVLTASAISTGGDTNRAIISYMRRFDPDKLDPEAHAEFISRIRRVHADANQGDWKRFIKHTIWNCENFPGFTDEELQRMDQPFQLIYGTKDRLVKDYEVKRLKDLIPDLLITEVEGGHALTSDEKTAPIVNQLVYDFITGVRR